VLKAVSWMAEAVRQSATSWDATGAVPRPLFKLDPDARGEASLFEAEFLLAEVRYVYGFEVSDERIETEWLFEYATERRRTLFLRDADASDGYDFKGRWLKGELEQIKKLTRPNALFVSMAAQLNHPQLTEIFEWFQGVSVVNGTTTSSTLIFKSDRWFAEVKPLLAIADLGIVGGSLVDPGFSFTRELTGRAKETAFEIHLQHKGAEGPVDLSPREESRGTLTWISTARTVLDALRSGSVVLHDELDASLHPNLVAEVLRAFRDPKANPRGAQLICTPHDVSLLGSAHVDAPLDRREVWITEKDELGRSELYPLTDAHPATQENLERGYLRGRYGGVPRVGAGWLAMDVARLLNESDAPADVEGA
jgi:hypothetical protein